MNIYVRFSSVSEQRKMKNRNLWSIQFLFFSFLFFLTQNGNETNTEIKEKQPNKTNNFFKSASILFECFCCNGSRLYYFRMKSRKTSEKR